MALGVALQLRAQQLRRAVRHAACTTAATRRRRRVRSSATAAMTAASAALPAPGSPRRMTAASAALPAPAGPPRRYLVAFDYDHTIVDGNTDTHVVKAAPPGGALPPDLKPESGRWTEYMQRVLAHLHSQGVSARAMQEVLQQLPYTPGMSELLTQLQSGSVGGVPCSSIIVSDSNSLFIDWSLKDHHRSPDLFTHTYTNPAHVCEERGVLVQPHHSHGCSCPVNLCKAAVLEQHLAVHHPEATRDGRGTGGASLCIAYVGDGGNDLCPAQKLLGPQDVLFVRAGYALDKLLKDAAVRASVSARVVVWTSGAEILAWLRANSSGQPEQASEAQPGPAE